MNGVPEIALWGLLIVATATDLRWGKIPNWLTFPFIVTGPFFTGTDGLLAVVIAFALFFPLWLTHAVAAGDVKLLMALAAWSKPSVVLQVAGVGILFGAVVGLGILLYQKGFKGSARSLAENVKSGAPSRTAVRMPFAPAFFCAYLIFSVAQLRGWELL